jgi:hypothetical protein
MLRVWGGREGKESGVTNITIEEKKHLSLSYSNRQYTVKGQVS